MQPLGSVADLIDLMARGSEVRDEPELDGLTHALQCGAILRVEHPADPELAVAGLVHDIADIAYPDDHTDHDRRGAALVAPLLGTRVARLVGAHVIAKRYLVTTDPRYRRRLSVRSAETLAVQGDALADADLAALGADPDLAAILDLRRADERAKDPEALVAGLETWRPLLSQVAAMSKSVSFDRIVETYDQTRGGLPVGRTFANAAAQHIAPPPARIVELGVGTGLVALPLTERGYTVLGVDLSSKMIAVARDRIGARVAVGDATPRADRFGIMRRGLGRARVLHVVGDPGAVLVDAGRMLRPGGRVVVILAGSNRATPRDDIAEATRGMHAGRLRGPDTETVIELASATGVLDLVERGLTEPINFDESPRDHIDKIRKRTWSGFWEIDDETWARTAEPAIERLLALPDQDRPRRRERAQRLCVFERR